MPLLGFLVAALYVPLLPSATEVGRWGVMLIGAVLILRRSTMTGAHWAGLAFLAWSTIGLLWSFSPWDTLGGVLHLIVLALLFCVAAETASLDGALTGFGLGITVSALFSLSQWIGYQPLFHIQDHPAGLFLTKNAAVEAAAPVLVWAILTRRWWAIPGALITIVPSGAREVYLMLAGAGTYLLMRYAYRKPGGTRWTALAALGMVLSFGALLIICVAAWSDAETVSINQRLEIWQVALAAWWLHPMGWGLNAFGSMFMSYGFAHNDYIQLLTETGPAVILVLAVFWCSLSERTEDFVAKACLASLLASALVWWPLQQPASAFLVAVLCGHLCGLRVRIPQPGRRSMLHAGLWPARLAARNVWGVELVRQAVAARPQHPLGGGEVPRGLER